MEEVWVSGKAVYADRRGAYFTRRQKIYFLQSQNMGAQASRVACLPPQNLRDRIGSLGSWSSRLLRSGVHHFVPLSDGKYLIWKGQLVLLVEPDGSIGKSWRRPGSRPLAIANDGTTVYSGDYVLNPSRNESVRVWSFDAANCSWREVWRFEHVRHVHGVFVDPYDSSLWVTTGDDGDEAAIWRTEDWFTTLQRKMGGTQQLRAIQLLFTPQSVFFGSDTPLEQNYIYRLDKASGSIERLQEVSGSVFHACRVGEWFFFSTAVEPSKVNKSRDVEIWASPDGMAWKCIKKFRKDALSMRYFQYGQAFFPAGPGDGKNVWITPFATTEDRGSLRMSLSEVAALN